MDSVGTGMRNLLHRLYKSCISGSLVCSREGCIMNYFLYVVSYYCDILKGEEMSAFWQGASLKRPCNYWKVTVKSFENVCLYRSQDIKQTVEEGLYYHQLSWEIATTRNKGSIAKKGIIRHPHAVFCLPGRQQSAHIFWRVMPLLQTSVLLIFTAYFCLLLCTIII